MAVQDSEHRLSLTLQSNVHCNQYFKFDKLVRKPYKYLFNFVFQVLSS